MEILIRWASQRALRGARSAPDHAARADHEHVVGRDLYRANGEVAAFNHEIAELLRVRALLSSGERVDAPPRRAEHATHHPAPVRDLHIRDEQVNEFSLLALPNHQWWFYFRRPGYPILEST